MTVALGGAMLVWGMPAIAHAKEGDNRADTMGLHIAAGVSLLYDDNVFRVDDRIDDPQSDIIVTPSVEVEYSHPVGRHDFSARAKAGYDRFLSEGQRSKLRLDGEVKAVIRFGSTCSITPRAAYRQQRADYGDINQATENLQRFTTLAADLDCERPGVFPIAGYERNTTRNSDPFDYADQTSDSFRGGIGLAKPSLGTITAYYERTISDRRALGIENRITAYAVRFQRSVSPLTRIDADLRWLDVSSDSAAIGDYSGPGWDVSLTTSVIPRLKLTATTERGIVNDSLIASGFAVRSRYRLEGEIAISELTSAGLYAELERRKFRQDAALRAFGITADRNRRFGATLRRTLTDRAELLIDAQHYVRRTDTSISNYSGTQVTLSALLQF